jgi:Prokaryotic phospholipase A2
VLGNPVNFVDPLGLFWADMSNAGDFTFPCSSCGANGGQRFPNGYFGNWSFEESCQRHDECYSFSNAKKSQCDNNFLDHMKWQCKNIKDPALKQMCLNQASAYYFAVDRFGTSAFNNAKDGVK